MASFRCYDNSDVIAFLIMTNFHLYLIKLWWQFFQMFVYGDVVMLRIGTYWPWKTVTVSSHLHMPVRPLLLHRMAIVSFRLYVSEKFGQLAKIFWANGLPPPLAKNFPYTYAFNCYIEASERRGGGGRFFMIPLLSIVAEAAYRQEG